MNNSTGIGYSQANAMPTQNNTINNKPSSDSTIKTQTDASAANTSKQSGPKMQKQLQKDTVTLFGKDVEKKKLAIGAGILGSISIIGTLLRAAYKGNVILKYDNNDNAKLGQKIKEGLKAMFTTDGKTKFKDAKKGKITPDNNSSVNANDNGKPETPQPDKTGDKGTAASGAPVKSVTPPPKERTGNSTQEDAGTKRKAEAMDKGNKTSKTPTEAEGQNANSTVESKTLGAGNKNDTSKQPETKESGAGTQHQVEQPVIIEKTDSTVPPKIEDTNAGENAGRTDSLSKQDSSRQENSSLSGNNPANTGKTLQDAAKESSTQQGQGVPQIESGTPIEQSTQGLEDSSVKDPNNLDIPATGNLGPKITPEQAVDNILNDDKMATDNLNELFGAPKFREALTEAMSDPEKITADEVLGNLNSLLGEGVLFKEIQILTKAGNHTLAQCLCGAESVSSNVEGLRIAAANILNKMTSDITNSLTSKIFNNQNLPADYLEVFNKNNFTGSLTKALTDEYFEHGEKISQSAINENLQNLINGEKPFFSPDEIDLILNNKITGVDFQNTQSASRDFKQYLITGNTDIVAGLKTGMKNASDNAAAAKIQQNLEKINAIIENNASDKVKKAISADLRLALAEEADELNIWLNFEKKLNTQLEKLSEEELEAVVRLNEEDIDIFLNYLAGQEGMSVKPLKKAAQKLIQQENSGIDKTDRIAKNILDFMYPDLDFRARSIIKKSDVPKIIAETCEYNSNLLDLLKENTEKLMEDFSTTQLKYIVQNHGHSLADYLTTTEKTHTEIYEFLRDEALLGEAYKVCNKKSPKWIIKHNLPHTRGILHSKEMKEILPADIFDEEFCRFFAKCPESYNISSDKVLKNAQSLTDELGLPLDVIKGIAGDEEYSENLIYYLLNSNKTNADYLLSSAKYYMEENAQKLASGAEGSAEGFLQKNGYDASPDSSQPISILSPDEIQDLISNL